MGSKPFTTLIPAADGQPALSLAWPSNCQPVMDDAVRHAEQWLYGSRRSNLWTTLLVGRQQQGDPFRRTAYELAFLVRLQQRLLACERLGDAAELPK